MRCAACGYGEPDHSDGRCPVCVCGEVVDAHAPIAAPPAPLLAFAEAGKIARPCPGKDTQLRHGKLRPDDPVPRRYWHGLLAPLSPREIAAREAAQAPEIVTGPPQVPARPPVSAGEFAGYQGKQAVGLGRLAQRLGWAVVPLYWRDFAGAEGCGVWLSKGPLRAVATWKRAAGNLGAKSGWGSDVVYAWRVDVERFPTAITVKQLEGIMQ